MTAPKAPPLPSLRALTAELRELQEAWSHPEAGGEYASLALATENAMKPHRWGVVAVSALEVLLVERAYGHEYIPGSVERECPKCAGAGRLGDEPDFQLSWCHGCAGSGRVSVPSPFDAVAAARRLLSAARDGGAR